MEESRESGLVQVDLKYIISTIDSLVMDETTVTSLALLELNLPIFPPQNPE
jgi:hypothetical protein